MTAPRGISQPPTSFIGSQCQGIHHAPLNTYNTKNHKNEKKSHHNKPHTHPPRNPKAHRRKRARSDARNHYPQIKHHTPPPRRGDNNHPHPTPPQKERKPEAGTSHPRGWAPLGLLPQDPTVCLVAPGGHVPVPGHKFCLSRTRTRSTTDTGPSNESPRSPNPHTMWAGLSLVVLLRKEVIQPHLPVRLPCYDFVPIADPTFDGSLHKG